MCLAAAALPALTRDATAGAAAAATASDWASSPFRSFGAPAAVLAGKVQFSDETDDAAFRAALGSGLKRLRAELHDRQGWADPIAEGDPLRVYVTRTSAEGIRRLAARGVDRHRLVGASIEIDGTGLSGREILHEVARLYAQATLEAYGAPDHTFLSDAAAESLADAGLGAISSEDRHERMRIAAAAPALDLTRNSDSLGRVYVEEFSRAAGPAALRGIWERAAQTGEEVLPVLLRAWSETTGEKEDALLLRSAARLYTLVEPEAAPSRLGFSDLAAGALDAATPVPFSVRHRAFLPSADATGALRVAWPDRAAPAAAVVRYRDTALPADVVFWTPGSSRTIPLAGVSRVDWVVAGTAIGPPLDELAAAVDPVASFPFSNVSAQATAGPLGPRIMWTTAAHDGLAGWALFREEVQPDGRIVRTGPQILPSTKQADESFRYAFVDSDAAAGTFYRYSVWAVTDDGLLAKAFSATLRTSD